MLVKNETEKKIVPFSVRRLKESFLLRSLLKPVLSDSSLLGDPGIMLVCSHNRIQFSHQLDL